MNYHLGEWVLELMTNQTKLLTLLFSVGVINWIIFGFNFKLFIVINEICVLIFSFVFYILLVHYC